MANYNLTQTGAEVQELLNKVSLFGKFTCSDAADSQVKNIHIDDFTLIDSVAIAVTFVNGNSAASIQLNVNDTGNVPVYYRNSPLGAGLFTANATVILMYNATGNRWDVLSELCGNVVYDISAAHPDGQGNPTPYADLTAALGTGGVNIPEDIRKGGMSIKFIQGTVQSYDNRYIQYRYMGTETTGTPNPFLDTANWQGVDDEPTEGSQNLVKSGGVSDAIFYSSFYQKNIMSDIVNITDLSKFKTGSKYIIKITANESINRLRILTRNSSNVNVQVFAIEQNLPANESLSFTWVKDATEVRLAADNNGGNISSATFSIFGRGDEIVEEELNSLVIEDTTGTAEQETKLRLSVKKTDIDGSIVNLSTLDLPSATREKAGLLSVSDKKSIDDVSGYVKKETSNLLFNNYGYIKSDGSVIEQNPGSYIKTDFIPIDDFISCHVKCHPSVSSIAFYSSLNTDSFIEGITKTYDFYTINKSDLDIPNNAHYVIICTSDYSTDLESASITFFKHVDGIKKIIQKIESAIPQKGFAHISFDDVVYCLHDITENADNYDSIFDNDFFAVLKNLHNIYGAIFSLFVFLEDTTAGEYATGWSLASTTTKFKKEFSANSDWLKFGLHAPNKSTNYNNRTAANTEADYESFVNSIIAITGSIDCIDRLPRLANFAGTEENLQVLRDCDAGIIGALAAYDTRNSYYLTSKESELAFKNGVLTDSNNHLIFYTSLMALETIEPNSVYADKDIPSKMGRFFNLEWMMHEYAIGGQNYGYSSYDFDTMVTRLTNACKIACENGYRWGYPQCLSLISGL